MKRIIFGIINFIISIIIGLVFLGVGLYIIKNFIKSDFFHSVRIFDIVLLIIPVGMFLYGIIIYWYSIIKKKYKILKISIISVIIFGIIFGYLLNKIKNEIEFKKVIIERFENNEININGVIAGINIKFENKGKNMFIPELEIKIPNCFHIDGRLKIKEKKIEKESKLNYGKYGGIYKEKDINGKFPIHIFNPNGKYISYLDNDDEYYEKMKYGNIKVDEGYGFREFNGILLPQGIYLKSNGNFCKSTKFGNNDPRSIDDFFILSDWKKGGRCFSGKKYFSSYVFSRENFYKTLFIPKHKYKDTEFEVKIDFDKIFLLDSLEECISNNI